VLLSHQPIDLPAEMQGYAFAARYAPLGEVLPRCAALIHHGGIGTTASAFSAGIPQLVVPIAFDQFDHAERVKRIGCGDSVYRRRFTPERAARRLARLLTSEEIAGRCAAIAAHSGQGDAIADICDAIEREGAFRLRRKRLAAGA
jgi:UDP:flavonoid glycosyltransferase YjiC (YdhE family)